VARQIVLVLDVTRISKALSRSACHRTPYELL